MTRKRFWGLRNALHVKLDEWGKSERVRPERIDLQEDEARKRETPSQLQEGEGARDRHELR